MTHRATITRVLTALLLVVSGSLAKADGIVPDRGAVVSGFVQVAGKRIPLPPGSWQVSATSFARIAGTLTSPYGAIARIVLIPPNTDPGRGVLMVETNVLPVRGGWGAPLECQSDESLLRDAASARDLHEACSFVILRRRNAVADMFSGLLPNRLPQTALAAGFRVSDRQDMVEMRYAVATDPLKDHAPGGSGDPEVNALGAWARKARSGALTAIRLPASQVATDLIRAPGLAAPPDGPSPAALLSQLKDSTFSAALGVASVTTASLLAGSLYTGFAVATWQGLTHSAVWFANEMAWEWPARPPVMPIVMAFDSPLASTPPASFAAAPSTVTIDSKGVPLPGGGKWDVIMTDAGKEITTTVLAKVENGRLAGLAIVHTNPIMRTAIYGTDPQCSNSNNTFAVIRYDTPEDGFCAYGRMIDTDMAPPQGSVWETALGRLRSLGMDVPAALDMVSARARTRENLLDIAWFIPIDPSLRRTSLAAFADLVQQPMELAVRGRPDFQAALLPWPIQEDAVTRAILAQAIDPLSTLNKDGVIDRDSLQAQTALAEAALTEREAQRLPLSTLGAYKTATYRLASFVDAVGVSWLVTASAPQSFAYAAIDAVVQPVLAYGNDILWAGSVPEPLGPVNFPAIGRPRP